MTKELDFESNKNQRDPLLTLPLREGSVYEWLHVR
jgi:hypothetical protein